MFIDQQLYWVSIISNVEAVGRKRDSAQRPTRAACSAAQPLASEKRAECSTQGGTDGLD